MLLNMSINSVDNLINRKESWGLRRVQSLDQCYLMRSQMIFSFASEIREVLCYYHHHNHHVIIICKIYHVASGKTNG